jgi:adenosylcobyric acid synthase
MVLGTASHVGKSLIAAGLGRIFADEGVRVAPFKAQNMSLNSAATPDGREIGRAQALQAEACRVAARAEMNPVLIKPSCDTGAQIVLLGRVWGQVTASDYHQRRVEELFPAVLASYASLAAEHELIVLEGAGSPAEINLRAHDIVNMRMAHAADAACVLVGDIDRGGVFASLLGTVELLDPEDRARIRGFVVNKFRGDVSLLARGIEMMERRIGIPCAGVVPYLHDLGLEEEDSVALEDRRTVARAWRDVSISKDRALRIGVVAFPYMANFTDFDALALEPSVALAFLDNPAGFASADVLILPGSKQTLDDLAWLRARGFAAALSAHRGPLIGICGGYQMLGLSIEDPAGVENGGVARASEGLGLLPVRTVMREQKTVRAGSGHDRGYEIHMGETSTAPGASVASGDRVWGTYVHGLFDNDEVRHNFIDNARGQCGLTPASRKEPVTANRQARIDRWADHLRRSLHLDLIREWTGLKRYELTRTNH